MTAYYVATTGNDTTGDGSSGNPYATLGKVASVAAAGDTCYMQAGTYNVGTGITGWSGMTLIGYASTITDGGIATLKATAAINILTLNSVADYLATIKNLEFDGNSGTGSIGIYAGSTYVARDWSYFYNCKFHNFSSHGAKIDYYNWNYSVSCDFYSNGGNGYISTSAYGARVAGCSFYSNTGDGCKDAAYTKNCISYGNSGNGFFTSNDYNGNEWCNVVAHNNSGSGIYIDGYYYDGMVIVKNSIFSSNGSYGIYAFGPSTKAMPYINSNAFYGNTSGELFNLSDVNHKTLSASPYVDSSTGNFALNNIAGGGADCRAAGIPSSVLSGATNSYPDIGAAQHADPRISPRTRPARRLRY